VVAEDEGSVSRWIDAMRDGDEEAAQAIWERYFDRLVRLARQRLRVMPKRSAEADEEDAAVSAFESFYQGLTRGQYPRLGGRDDLWKLLVVITARKVGALKDRQRALKRGGAWKGRTGRAGDDEDAERDALALLASPEPTPEFAATVAEELGRLLDVLGDESLRQIAVWRMEGYDRDEIADRLGCARRTVARRLELIRTLWEETGHVPGGA
jgi:DNA-directed RNA polymerase specialized sigma24 family protein